METLERFISEVKFFDGFPEEFTHIIVGCASNMVVKKGEYFFHESDEAHRFFAVREGIVAIEVKCPGHGSITMQTVDAGEVFGWSWLFEPHIWRYSARAQQDTRAFAFDGECLRKKIENNHHLGFELTLRFAHVVIDRLASCRMQLLDVCKKPENMIFAE